VDKLKVLRAAIYRSHLGLELLTTNLSKLIGQSTRDGE